MLSLGADADMMKYLLYLLLICFAGNVFAQSDFTSQKDRQTITKLHIKQITGYWFKNPAKPDEATLIDSLTFNNTGLCIHRKTNSYTYSYIYNARGTVIQQITKGKNKADSTVTVFRYDARGNMILSVNIRHAADIESIYPDYPLHKFEYGAHNELLREYWVNAKGQQIQRQRYKYVTKGLEPSLEKVVNFYDEHDKLTFIKKYYKNHDVKDFSVDNNKITFVAESVLNKKHDIEKFTDYYHLSTEAMQKVALIGHGHVKRDTVTEIYTYNANGFCTQKALYKHDKLIENFKWYFKP